MSKKKWHKHRKKPYVRPFRASRGDTLNEVYRDGAPMSRVTNFEYTENPGAIVTLTDGMGVPINAAQPMPVSIDTAGNSGLRIVDGDVNINSLQVSAEGMIGSDNISIENNNMEPGITLSEAVNRLDNRIVSLETPDPYIGDPNYMISNGNMLDLSNSLRNLSLEGYTEIELTDVLRDLLNGRRNGET